MDQQTIVYLYELFKTIFTAANVFLLVFFVFLVIKSVKYRPNFKIAEEEKKEIVYTLGNVVIRERWQSIVNRSRINSPEAMKLAVIDADNLVDELLKRMGLEGEHMADRLENLTTEDFRSLDRIWDAHRLRNRLVHESGFVVSREEAWKAIEDYASFLKEIRVIEE